LAQVVPVLFLFIALGINIYVLWLFARFVRAHEQIARSSEHLAGTVRHLLSELRTRDREDS